MDVLASPHSVLTTLLQWHNCKGMKIYKPFNFTSLKSGQRNQTDSGAAWLRQMRRRPHGQLQAGNVLTTAAGVTSLVTVLRTLHFPVLMPKVPLPVEAPSPDQIGAKS